MNTIVKDDIDKTSKAVTKILRQTIEGEIIWKIDTRELFLGAEEYVTGQVYMTEILNKYLRIYTFKYGNRMIYGKDNYFSGVKLQFTDYQGKPEWNFPYSNAVSDLYNTIAIKTANVDEFLNKWLNE